MTTTNTICNGILFQSYIKIDPIIEYENGLRAPRAPES